MRLLTTLLLAFLSFAAFGQHDHRNCATMENLAQQLLQDPAMQSRMQAIEQHTQQYQSADGVQFRSVIVIPVVFHIVHNGQAIGTGENVSDAIVLAQLEQLNQDMRKLNSDASLVPALFQGLHADTQIEFCLAQRTPSGTATNGINRINGGRTSWTRTQIENELKPSSIWDRNQYLNVWSVRFGGSDANLLGYAQFPGGSASTDGVVVLFSSMGSVANPNPGGGNYARGRTLTHEVGHWLNLRHIWGDATCGNDFVADTPVHQTSNGGCPAFPKTNNCSGGPWTEMTMNYMDYTYDACMYMFSAGQGTRMNAVLAPGGARASLTSSAGCVPPGGGGTCAVPGNLNATNITTNSATLNWGAVSGATSYNVRARQVGASTWSTGSATGTSLNFTGLTASTQYEFQVQAVCSGSTSNYSASTTFTTNGSCAVPGGLNATNITTNSATLNWGAVSGASSYNVRARQVGASTWSTGSATGTSLNFTSLTAATQYEFQVEAVCSGTTSNYSASATFTTQSAGCTDAYEPNNSRSSSLPLTPTNQDLFAQIATSTDRDWYRFANLSTARNIRVDLSDLPADYDTELWQNNTRRRRSQNGGTTPEVMIWNTNTTASNWYVHVYGYNGAFSNTQCYKLRISLSSSSFRTDGTTDGEVTEIEIPLEVLRSGFNMFPNPATDQLSIDIDMHADQTVKVALGDLTGRTHILRSFDLHKGDSRVTLDISRLPAGTYFVRVENGEIIGVQKLVIVR